MATVVHARQGDTVDLICYRHYGRTADITERAYRENHGLCEHGPVLPMGTAVTLPAIAPQPVRDTLQLWE